MIYRREIDGLRALAVVPVILCHAGFAGFRGGFVGVDIFFVISGFLITSIILAEREAGTFTIAGFYERRARRILPALTLVVCCTIPFAWMWMPPAQLREFADSLVAVAVFCSNFLFWSESGYFEGAAFEKPLLHTWSLAIEEQYYVVFPILLQVFWFLGRWKLGLAIVAGASASFALSVWGFPTYSAANYYLMPSRAWELLAGSILAFIGAGALKDRVGASMAEFLSGAGLLAIVTSIFIFDETTPFPGMATLLPVAGTWLLLAFATQDTLVGRFLSLKWLVGIGLISYSAYLWHQPLFAFARLRSFNEPTPAVYGVLCAAALALAYLSWRYIELPFRERRRFACSEIFAGGAFATAAVVSIGLVGALTSLNSARFTAAQLAVIEPAGSVHKDCDWQKPIPGFPKIKTCRFGAGGRESPLVLLGDSHARALRGALEANLKQQGISGLLIKNSQCEQLAGIYLERETSVKTVKACEEDQSALLAYLRGIKPRAIVVAMRWTISLFPIEGMIDSMAFDNGEGGREIIAPLKVFVARDAAGRFVTGAEAKADAIEKYLTDFADLGVPVIVQYPVPEIGWNVPNLNFKNLAARGKFPEVISISASRFAARNSFVTAVLDSLVGKHMVVGVKPGTLLCNSYVSSRCVAQFDTVPFYVDDDHLSTVGARPVVAEIMRHIAFQAIASHP